MVKCEEGATNGEAALAVEVNLEADAPPAQWTVPVEKVCAAAAVRRAFGA